VIAQTKARPVSPAALHSSEVDESKIVYHDGIDPHSGREQFVRELIVMRFTCRQREPDRISENR